MKVKRYCELKVEVGTLVKVSKNKSGVFSVLLQSELCVLRGYWTEIWKLRCFPYEQDLGKEAQNMLSSFGSHLNYEHQPLQDSEALLNTDKSVSVHPHHARTGNI